MKWLWYLIQWYKLYPPWNSRYHIPQLGIIRNTKVLVFFFRDTSIRQSMYRPHDSHMNNRDRSALGPAGTGILRPTFILKQIKSLIKITKQTDNKKPHSIHWNCVNSSMFWTLCCKHRMATTTWGSYFIANAGIYISTDIPLDCSACQSYASKDILFFPGFALPVCINDQTLSTTDKEVPFIYWLKKSSMMWKTGSPHKPTDSYSFFPNLKRASERSVTSNLTSGEAPENPLLCGWG